MTQDLLLWGTAIAMGLFTAGLVWVFPDLLARLRADRAERSTAKKLKLDAAALLEQAQDRDK